MTEGHGYFQIPIPVGKDQDRLDIPAVLDGLWSILESRTEIPERKGFMVRVCYFQPHAGVIGIAKRSFSKILVGKSLTYNGESYKIQKLSLDESDKASEKASRPLTLWVSSRKDGSLDDEAKKDLERIFASFRALGAIESFKKVHKDTGTVVMLNKEVPEETVEYFRLFARTIFGTRVNWHIHSDKPKKKSPKRNQKVSKSSPMAGFDPEMFEMFCAFYEMQKAKNSKNTPRSKKPAKKPVQRRSPKAEAASSTETKSRKPRVREDREDDSDQDQPEVKPQRKIRESSASPKKELKRSWASEEEEERSSRSSEEKKKKSVIKEKKTDGSSGSGKTKKK